MNRILPIVIAFGVFTASRIGSANGNMRWENEDVITEEDLCSLDSAETVQLEIDPVVVLIGRISNGIMKIMNGQWWVCGALLDKERQREESVAIAYRVVQGLVDKNSAISPWGVVGTMYNESRFDRCALGKNPRKVAYEIKALVENKNTISHTESDVLKYVKSKDANKYFGVTGFDLGYCQILSRFYYGPEEDMLDATDGVKICLGEMIKRANSTMRPWLYWRSPAGVEWYRAKIKRWAKIMGATSKELKAL